MTMYNTVIISIDELWLKGKNRPFYFKTLRKNIKLLLKSLGINNAAVSVENHRFIVNSDEPFSDEVIRAVSNIPGTNSVIPAIRIEKEMAAVYPAVEQELKRRDLSGIKTFRITSKRSDKKFPVKSMDLSNEIGALVIKSHPQLNAKMVNPDLEVGIRVLSDYIYISSRKLTAPGGLPVGTNGHLITMLSGGIDSPVASYLMSKRGCSQTFMFFYAWPMVGEDVMDKIEKLISILGKYQTGCRLHVVRFGDFQKKLAKLCKNEYRTVLFRKYMMECGSILARKTGGQALLTGDSLGQVSSQTISNIAEIDHFTNITIFRPLVGLNKIEIIEVARKIGTYDTSIIPFDDACSMLAPRHPVLRSERRYIEKFIGENDFSEDLEKLVKESEIIKIDPAGRLTRSEPLQ